MDGQRLRILALEPDEACREHLGRLLRQRIEVDVVMTSTAEEAAGAMHTQRPDLVLTSAVLPPRAEEQVIDALKHLDPDGTVPVMTVPPLLDPTETPDLPRGVFGLIARRRPAPRRPSYDLGVLAARIDEALRQVREAKEYPRIRPSRVDPSTALMLRSAVDGTLATMPSVSIVDGAEEPLLLQRKRLERAPRFGMDELPSRCTLTTPAGFIVRMLNVSETGVLFDSPLKFMRDSETALSLLGADTTLVLPARIVRSEVATVNGVGVTYQTAAQFNETLDLLKRVAPPAEALQAVAPPPQMAAAPSSLADLLVRITTDLYQHHRGEAARSAFEAGLRQLLPTCDVVLCDRLVAPSAGGDSIYFAVPGASGAMVQATFEPGHQPTVEEFKLLKAAAAMASVIVHGETHSLLVRRSA
jgi:CheY-like chemotaxis protein